MLLEYKEEYQTALADIFYKIYYNPPFSYEWLKRSEVERYFNDLAKTPNFLGYVIKEDNKIIGGCFGVINDYFKNIKYKINEIFIAKEYQGLGYGSKALRQIEALVYEKNAVIIELSTDREAFAFNFYKKNGFISSKHMAYLLKPIKI